MYQNTNFYLKIIEYFCLAFVTLFGLVLAVLFLCKNQICVDYIPSFGDFSWVILVFVCIFAILNSLRIWFDFNSFDINPSGKKRLFFGLAGLSLSYILCAIFFREINLISGREILISGAFLFILLTLSLSFLLLFILSDVWERAPKFSKVRLSLSTIHLVAILFNPIVGTFMSLFIIPYMILFSEFKTKKIR